MKKDAHRFLEMGMTSNSLFCPMGKVTKKVNEKKRSIIQKQWARSSRER